MLLKLFSFVPHYPFLYKTHWENGVKEDKEENQQLCMFGKAILNTTVSFLWKPMQTCLGSATPDISQWIQIKNKTYKHLQNRAYNKDIEAFHMSSIFGKLLVGLGFLFTDGKKFISLNVHQHCKYLITLYCVFIINLFSFALDISNNSFHCFLDRPKYSTVYHSSQKDFLIFSQNSLFFTSSHYSWLYTSLYIKFSHSKK